MESREEGCNAPFTAVTATLMFVRPGQAQAQGEQPGLSKEVVEATYHLPFEVAAQQLGVANAPLM